MQQVFLMVFFCLSGLSGQCFICSVTSESLPWVLTTLSNDPQSTCHLASGPLFSYLPVSLEFCIPLPFCRLSLLPCLSIPPLAFLNLIYTLSYELWSNELWLCKFMYVNYYYLCFIAFKTCIGNTKFITLTIFTCKVQKC